MGATGGLQATAYGIQGASALAGSISQAGALSAQGAYQQSVANTNAGFSRMQGQDALRRGDFQGSQAMLRARGLQGAQRASYAAQGVDVNTGSAASVQSETGTLGALDALTIKNNAWKQAWGSQVQAEQYESQGQFQKMAAENQAGQTLLTGGMQAAAFGFKGVGAYWGQKPQSSDEEWGLIGMGNK